MSSKKILISVLIFVLLITLLGSLVYNMRGNILKTFWRFYPDTVRFIEVTSDFDNIEETTILMTYPDNLIIKNGKPGDWDESIREIGNMVYSTELNKYFLYYSGHKGKINRGNNVYVGMTWSEDGIKWEKFGKVLEVPSEDPYVVIDNGTFHLFYEDKSEIPFRKIDLAISKDGKSFEVIKRGVIEPRKDSWQSQDVSSPVVVKTNYGWAMLYEGRSEKNRGAIGFALSENLVDWVSKQDPVFKGRYKKPWDMYLFWDNYLVPDDILNINNKYLLMYHGLSSWHLWQSGLAVSNDLITWEKANEFSIHPASTVMFANFNLETLFFLATDRGIEYYKPLKGSVFSQDFYMGQWERINK